jgi:hypothetical protein
MSCASMKLIYLIVRDMIIIAYILSVLLLFKSLVFYPISFFTMDDKNCSINDFIFFD